MSDSWLSFLLPEMASPACWVQDFWDSGWPVEAADWYHQYALTALVGVVDFQGGEEIE